MSRVGRCWCSAVASRRGAGKGSNQSLCNLWTPTKGVTWCARATGWRRCRHCRFLLCARNTAQRHLASSSTYRSSGNQLKPSQVLHFAALLHAILARLPTSSPSTTMGAAPAAAAPLTPPATVGASARCSAARCLRPCVSGNSTAARVLESDEKQMLAVA